MRTLSALPALCEGTVNDWFSSQMVSNVEFWCFLCCYLQQTFAPTVDLLVIWDILALMWHHCNVFSYRMQTSRERLLPVWSDGTSVFLWWLWEFLRKTVWHEHTNLLLCGWIRAAKRRQSCCGYAGISFSQMLTSPSLHKTIIIVLALWFDWVHGPPFYSQRLAKPTFNLMHA